MQPVFKKKKKRALRLFTKNKWRTRQTWKNRDLVENRVQSMGFTDRRCEKEVKVCTNFSTGLNAVLIGYHYPLPSQKAIFAKLNGGNFFLNQPQWCVSSNTGGGRMFEVDLYQHPSLVIQVQTSFVRGQGCAGNLPTSNGHYAERPWLHGCIFGRHINEQSKCRTI